MGGGCETQTGQDMSPPRSISSLAFMLSKAGSQNNFEARALCAQTGVGGWVRARVRARVRVRVMGPRGRGP